MITITKKKEPKKLEPKIIDNRDMERKHIEMLKKEFADLMPENQELQNNKGEIVNTSPSVIKVEDSNTNADSFFRKVIGTLFSKENLGGKTEYSTHEETFAGAKLEYIGKYCDVPGASEFLAIHELKKLSFQRKSRIELIKSLERREEEQRFQAQQNSGNFLSRMG